ncbi:hypothetical protein Y032_0112g299 [Ancylostoma ceylanicum]|nr:hypothetical protein Y032_0112g299 [Ancylostoma ceylanicum]
MMMLYLIAIWLISISQCSGYAITTPMSCPTNETYNSCGNICELKCEDIYEEEERPCTRNCDRGACVCEKGFYRNKEDRCVTEYDCQIYFMEFVTFEPGRGDFSLNCSMLNNTANIAEPATGRSSQLS